MAHSTRFAVKFRRRREGATNYKKRLKLLQSRLPRLVIRKSNKYILMQITNYTSKGDKTAVTAHSSELKALGWKFGMKNTPAAYLTGLLMAKKAREQKIQQAIADVGLYTATNGAKVFAALKGAADGGLNVAYNPSVAPKEGRINGKHIAEYLKKPDITQNFEQIKQKIK